MIKMHIFYETLLIILLYECHKPLIVLQLFSISRFNHYVFKMCSYKDSFLMGEERRTEGIIGAVDSR